MIEDMYREEMLEHYKNPQNKGKIKRADASYHDFNPVCGDEIEVFLKIAKGKISDIKFEGKGCAISQASASILTEEIKGKALDEISKMKKEDVLEILPIEVSHLRIKCALLSMKAVQKAILKYKGEKNA